MLAQVTSVTFVCVDMPVDRLMADLQFAFQLKPIGGLFWAEVFPDQPLDFRPAIR